MLQNLAVFFPCHDSASCRDDLVRFGGAISQKFRLQLPESFFAVFFKDFGDRFSGPFGNEMIGIDKAKPQALGHLFTNGGLSRAHKSDQNQIATALV